MNLYRKYRPATFEEVFGNEAEVEALKNKITQPQGKRPHTFLIEGPSGCGKTTLARIAARELGGDELSIMEVNTANNRGIDTAREITDTMRTRSASGAPRIWIIDEVHKTTKDWQNAMLKPLEDTGSAFFFLCTTDPQMLLQAVKTRCTVISVKPLKSEKMMRLLRLINMKEELKVPVEILEEIVEASWGSPRQALVTLEKIAGLPEEEMRTVITTEGGSQKKIGDLIKSIQNGPWSAIASCIKSLQEEMDQESIRRAVIGYTNAVLLNGKGDANLAIILENFAEPYWGATNANTTLVAYQSYSEIKNSR